MDKNKTRKTEKTEKTENTPETAYERVQTARHPERPYTSDLLTAIFTDFQEIHGDRRFGDDAAMICGYARLDGLETAIIGQQKGRDITQRRFRNFGMAKPEGYRKALRLMKQAEKFGRPLITLIDTPGAYPGIDAEERGQAEAIARNLREMANLKIPTIAVVLGEGGSGGALGIAVADRVLILENAVYSVITPEGCAAILWKDAGQAARAAENLRLTAAHLQEFGLVDEIINEPAAWTIDTTDAGKSAAENDQRQKSFAVIAENLKAALQRNLRELLAADDGRRNRRRFEKFKRMGRWLG